MLDKPEVIQDLLRRLRILNPVPPPKYGSNAKRIEKLRATIATWQAEHPSRVRRYRKKYEASQHGRAILSVKRDRRRALQFGCEGSHAAQEWLDKKAQYGYRCAYCHRKLRRLTKDHIVPLSKGGTNYIYNIVPACRRCNSSKHNKDVLAWEKFSGLQLPLSRS